MDNLPPDHIKSRKAAKDGGFLYFYGSPCRKGHEGLRYASGHCVSCQVERAKLEENILRKNKQRAANRHVAKAYNKRYYMQNRDNEIERAKKYRSENKDKVRETQKASRIKRIDRIKADIARWRKQNPDACRAHEAKRRELYKNGNGWTQGGIDFLMKFQRAKCAICKSSILEKKHIDHIVPLSKGGAHDKRNIQLLCQPCNSSKYNKDPIIWAQENGRLL